jgi:MFS transporter, putative metabolite:H+ symporter
LAFFVLLSAKPLIPSNVQPSKGKTFVSSPNLDLTPPALNEKRRLPKFTRRNINIATIVALAAGTVAVFDYGLFGALLPAMRADFGWTETEAYAINTWIAVGTAIVCFAIGPVIDRLGRRKGMMTTVGGTAVVSGVTALIPAGIPFISNGLMVLVVPSGALASPSKRSTQPI